VFFFSPFFLSSRGENVTLSPSRSQKTGFSENGVFFEKFVFFRCHVHPGSVGLFGTPGRPVSFSGLVGLF
jgi:hypothetical protein